ncbi:MAG: penicillin acylase family protein [Deltaproteobacteria bacterium]|nr:penicillin acylase family protein [Deltaproteobacteria bacterium]
MGLPDQHHIPGASIFYMTLRAAWKLTFEDDLSPKLYALMVETAYNYALLDRLIAEVPDARVFDRKDTPGVETRDDIIARAFKESVARLAAAFGDDPVEWWWGKLHKLTFPHPLGSVSALSSTFNVGPHPMPGALEVPFAEGFNYEGDLEFSVRYGPAFRMIHDFGAEDDGGMVVDLGQSGWAKTDYYANGFRSWREGKVWKLSMDKERYSKNALGTLTLAP